MCACLTHMKLNVLFFVGNSNGIVFKLRFTVISHSCLYIPCILLVVFSPIYTVQAHFSGMGCTITWIKMSSTGWWPRWTSLPGAPSACRGMHLLGSWLLWIHPEGGESWVISTPLALFWDEVSVQNYVWVKPPLEICGPSAKAITTQVKTLHQVKVVRHKMRL